MKEACEALKQKMQPAAIGVVCTSRFAHSERKVYKNFFRNCVVFIADKRRGSKWRTKCPIMWR